MNKLSTAVAFIFGAGIGSAATWYFLKSKYETISNEEKESYKNYYEKKLAELNSESKEESQQPDEATLKRLRNKDDISKYVEKIKPYTNYSDISTTEEPSTVAAPEEEESYSERPYVIPPEEFDELEGYNTISLLYFADEVLTDDDYSIIENVEETVGKDSLKTFGRYEDDSVYVRNDRLKCDYEILKDERRFEDIKLARMRNGLD
jgi:hypothetical protein